MSFLNKADILAFSDLARVEVAVPEWGGSVLVRCMTASQRDMFEARQIAAPFVDIRARLAAATICDESGVLVFSLNDVAALGAKSAKALDRVFAVATKLSGLSKDDVEELKKS